MSNFHTQVNVTRNCLLEFLDILDQNKCHDICITYSDFGWHVQYESPFTRAPEKCCDEPKSDHVKKYPQFEMDSCEECNIVHSCIARYDMDRASWKCAKGKVHLNCTEIHDAPVKEEPEVKND